MSFGIWLTDTAEEESEDFLPSYYRKVQALTVPEVGWGIDVFDIGDEGLHNVESISQFFKPPHIIVQVETPIHIYKNSGDIDEAGFITGEEFEALRKKGEV